MAKLVLNEKYLYLKDWVRDITQNFERSGEVIYNARNQIRVFTLPDGQKVNVKRYRQPFFLNRVVYTFFRKPKAVRAYQYAFRLLEKGVATPEPIAYILEKKCGLLAVSYLVTVQSPLKRNFYEFGKGPLEGRENILVAFARFTAELHKKGIYHKDYSPGNILFDVCGDKVDFTVVDINRMKFDKVSLEKGCKNFARLWGRTDMFKLLAQVYASSMGYDQSRVEKLMLQYRNEFWKNKSRQKYEFLE